jgi:hypothetical protein
MTGWAFLNKHVVLPVIHVTSDDGSLVQSLKSSDIAREAGADGVFVIGHGVNWTAVLAAHFKVARRHPDWFVGLNCLDLNPSNMFFMCSYADAIWTDRVQRARSDMPLWFGGTCFKYQAGCPSERVLIGRTEEAISLGVDVVTTSGPETGTPPDVQKIATMHSVVSAHEGKKLAIASGLSAENVKQFLPYADAFLVASSIESPNGGLDATKTSEFVRSVREG